MTPLPDGASAPLPDPPTAGGPAAGEASGSGSGAAASGPDSGAVASGPDAAGGTGAEDKPVLIHLVEPYEGTPPVVDSPELLAQAVALLAEGSGPFAIDAERAAGFRYSQRAHLVQIRRSGAGTHLIDPIPLTGALGGLAEVLDRDSWILHAASQDLPCLRELGLEPQAIFDTELAGRLLGRRLVGLGSMVAEDLGISLAKEHSAADWSVRPIPESWLNYAALDVEFLIPLRDKLAGELALSGKTVWAEQEFEHARLTPEPGPRPDPWRRTHQIGDVRTARGLAVVREVWLARDAIAQEQDLAPGKVLNDRAIVALAVRDPLPTALPNSREWRRFNREAWLAAYEKAMSLPAGELPPSRGPSRGGLPEPRVWPRLNPPAAARLVAVRDAVRERALVLDLPQENLLAPATQRRVAWESTRPKVKDIAAIAEADGARPWQVDNVAEPIKDALVHQARKRAKGE